RGQPALDTPLSGARGGARRGGIAGGARSDQAVDRPGRTDHRPFADRRSPLIGVSSTAGASAAGLSGVRPPAPRGGALMKRRLAILFTLLALAGVAWACRYSVRDTGFVDLGDENYQL